MVDENTAPAPAASPILPNTPEMEAFLGIGYGGMTVKDAKEIIEARKKDSAAYPFEMEQKARAFLAAYGTAPRVVSTRPMFKRPEHVSA